MYRGIEQTSTALSRQALNKNNALSSSIRKDSFNTFVQMRTEFLSLPLSSLTYYATTNWTGIGAVEIQNIVLLRFRMFTQVLFLSSRILAHAQICYRLLIKMKIKENPHYWIYPVIDKNSKLKLRFIDQIHLSPHHRYNQNFIGRLRICLVNITGAGDSEDF